MEIIRGSPHMVFPMGDASRVGEARRHAVGLAEALGFDELHAGRVALVVTELGTNLVKHATHGRLLIASRHAPAAEIEVLSIDQGPGIGDLERSMRDGYSTGGSPGTGLGAVQRLASEFDIYSSLPSGTVAVARVRVQGGPASAAAFRFGVLATCAPGETVCGDGWGMALDAERAALLLADGLGHGPEAAEAAQTAVALFEKKPFESLKEAMEHAHAALRMTRGAAVSTAILDPLDGSIRSAGAGNVMMRVVSGVVDRSLLAQHGTIGVQIRRVEEIRSEWPRHAMIVMYSDGVQSRWPADAVKPMLGRDPSLAAAVLWRDYCRGRDDATVVILRRKE